MSKKMVVILALVWLVILVAGVTSSLTLTIAGADSLPFTTVLSSAQEVVVTGKEYQSIERYARLDEVFQLIRDQYYEDVSEEDLILGAINGMVGALGDPYSYYETPGDVISEQEHQEGAYHGIGIQLMLTADYEVLVTRVFKDSPAEEAGFLAGDRLLTVNGENLAAHRENSIDVAKTLLIGEDGTYATVELLRGDQVITVEVTHADVVINRVESCMLTDDIGYIAIYEFMGDDVDGFRKALDERLADHAKALIVDIRSNPGGLLYDVVEIADQLLGEGLIVYVENRSGDRENYYSDSDAISVPLVVLVNENSASASEILAGAVQDHQAGTIIGTTTFGKGIVQSILNFPEDGAGLHLTTASYYTPAGRSIHGTGIEPDLVVEMAKDDEIAPNAPDVTRDTQLRTAVEFLEDELLKP